MARAVLYEAIAFVLVLFVHVKCAYAPPVLYFNQEKFDAKMKEKYIKAILNEASSQKPVNPLNIFKPGSLDYDGQQQAGRDSGVSCRGVGVSGAPWINYLVLAPPPAGLGAFKRLLRSIESDKDATGLCGVRVCIAFGGGSDEEVTEVSRAWSKESEIEIFFIPTYSDDPRERLHESVVWLAQFWKRDIVFVVSSTVVVPHDFSEIIRSSTKSGEAVFMPRFLESETRGWNRIDSTTLENAGMYVSDALKVGMYSEPAKTPLVACTKNKMKANMPKIYGLAKLG